MILPSVAMCLVVFLSREQVWSRQATMIVLAVYFISNFALSTRPFYRRLGLPLTEMLRVTLNAVICPLFFLLAGGVQTNFWYIYLICAMGFPGSVSVFLQRGVLPLLLAIGTGSYLAVWFIDAAIQQHWSWAWLMPAILQVSATVVGCLGMDYGRQMFRLDKERAAADRTARSVREAYDKLRLAQAGLVENSRLASLGEFSAGVAHEINNPLAIIVGCSSILAGSLEKDEVDRELLKRLTDPIERATDRITGIVQGLRLYARDETCADNEPVIPREIIATALGLCRDRLYRHDIRLEVEDVPAAIIDGKPGQLLQVLSALLTNAYEAVLHQAEESRWIRISFEMRPDALTIALTNGGEKPAKEVESRMMDPFFTTKAYGKGVGLGLSIARGIVLDHGGSLTYDRTGPHTRFLITLPCRREVVAV